MPVGRRIKDYSLIDITPLCLPAGKFHRIFHNPADIVHPADFHVVASPCHDLPHGIEMRDIGTCRLCRKRGGPGIGEEIQHPRLRQGVFFCLFYEFPRIFVYILPVRGLLRKHADMLECSQAEAQGKIRSPAASSVSYDPLVIGLPELLPCAAVFLPGPGKSGPGPEAYMRRARPFRIRHGLVPESLWLRPGQDLPSESLKFLKIA